MAPLVPVEWSGPASVGKKLRFREVRFWSKRRDLGAGTYQAVGSLDVLSTKDNWQVVRLDLEGWELPPGILGAWATFWIVKLSGV